MTTGRGSTSNLPGRFIRTVTEFEPGEQGAAAQQAEDGAPSVRPTRLHAEQCKSILVGNQSPDIPFVQSINPYRGCEHGCIYCFARPTHSYLELSPGLDFETEIFCKDNADQVLRQQLMRRSYQCQPLAIGAATDPYQPAERSREITRRLLQVLAAFQHPVTLITKSSLVLRDLDILAPMAAQSLVSVAMSVTTLDNRLKSMLEPRASAGSRRVEVIRELTRAGVPVTLLFAPVIPFINDHELEAIVAASADAGATQAGYVVLRLPYEVNPLWQQWLATHFPQRAAKVMSVVNGLHGGRDYRSEWFVRQTGQGAWADLIAQRFDIALRRHGMTGRSRRLRTDLFRRPEQQLSLF